MRRSLLLLPLCLVVALLAGCGNKGPLVMPTNRPATATPPPAPMMPAPAASAATPEPLQY